MKNNIAKVTMFVIPTNNMPNMKEFYGESLGFKIVTEYRQDDKHWWTGIKLSDDSLIITLSTFYENAKPGTMTLYLLAPDIEATHKDLDAKGLKPSQITPDLYGPGSKVRWFKVNDPEGNVWTVGEAAPQWK